MAGKSVHLYVLDSFADWEPSYAVARLNDPAWQNFVEHRVEALIGLTPPLPR